MKKILIIEDEADLREAMQTKLIADGYHVRTSTSSEEGLKFVIEQKPDLIILDIMTSSLHGAIFCERLRQLPVGSNDSKLLIFTNLDNKISREKFAPFHVSDYLIKSETSLDELSKKIKGLLDDSLPR